LEPTKEQTDTPDGSPEKLEKKLQRLETNKQDMEIALTLAIEHGDAVEDQLTQEIEERRNAEQRLQDLLGAVKRQRDDLEIALSTAIEHGDSVQEELQSSNTQLNSEVTERRDTEARLARLVSVINQQKQDLELLVETIASHGDEIGNSLQERLSVAETMAHADALTGLFNRRSFDEALAEEWKRNTRSRSRIALLVIDVDYFKAYNDTFGHQTGDQALISIARCLKSIARRDEDIIARYGGEEFVALLPNCSAQNAANIAEETCKQISELAIAHPASPLGHVTVSIGIASLVPDLETKPEVLFEAADSNLYQAKHAGRNQIFIADMSGDDTMDQNNEVIGDFIDVNEISRGEYLQLGFQPSSVPLQQRWRNNGLSADFLGDYVTTFFPKDETDPDSAARQADMQNAVAYIANELLENAMKYSEESLNQPTNINMYLGEEFLVVTETNAATTEQTQKYRDFVELLTTKDPMEFFVEQLEAKANDDIEASGLGFLTMINDYGASLAWRFSRLSDQACAITTEVKINI
jgi:diguanylate cyclase (GGDEF)-like protein